MYLYHNPSKSILLPLLDYPSYYTSLLFLIPTITAYIVGNYVIGGIFNALTISSFLHHRRTYKTYKGPDIVRYIDILLCIAVVAALITYYYDRELLWIGIGLICVSWVIAKIKSSMFMHSINHLLVIGFTTALLLE